MKITATSFVQAVADVDATADWWIEVMGFSDWMRPEGWRFVRRDGCMIMLGECPDAIPVPDLGDHQYFAYIYVDDANAYRDEIAAKGAEIIFGPKDQPWGMREMAVRTPDGHRFMVGQDLD